MYIFPNKFPITDIIYRTFKIDNLVNMQAIGVVVMTESAIPLQDAGNAHTAPSMYIFPNKFSIVYINQWNIENRPGCSL